MKSEQSVRSEFNRVCGLIKHKNDECKCCLEQKVYADALLWVLWKEDLIHGFRFLITSPGSTSHIQNQEDGIRH